MSESKAKHLQETFNSLKGKSFIFPFHSFSSMRRREKREIGWYTHLFRSLSNKCFKVYASEKSDSVPEDSSQNVKKEDHFAALAHAQELDVLARAYIEQETGEERVKMIFKKDFFMKYVQEFRIARKEFIREHNATIFRTRLEAVRRLQDHVSLRAGWEGARFAVKISGFSAGFVFISQMIASYRNKTSVLEYTAAAGITGGIARIKLGVKGIIVGSALGSVLGSIVGCMAYAFFKTYNMTQEERHVYIVKSMLEVWRSVEGDEAFKKKVEQLKQEQLAPS